MVGPPHLQRQGSFDIEEKGAGGEARLSFLGQEEVPNGPHISIWGLMTADRNSRKKKVTGTLWSTNRPGVKFRVCANIVIMNITHRYSATFARTMNTYHGVKGEFKVHVACWGTFQSDGKPYYEGGQG